MRYERCVMRFAAGRLMRKEVPTEKNDAGTRHQFDQS